MHPSFFWPQSHRPSVSPSALPYTNAASLTSMHSSPHSLSASIPAQHRTTVMISQHCTLSASCALHSLSLKGPWALLPSRRSTMACTVGSSADHALGFSLPQWDLVDSPAQNSWVLWTGPLHLPQWLSLFTIFLQLWKGTHTPRGMYEKSSHFSTLPWVVSHLSHHLHHLLLQLVFHPLDSCNTCLQWPATRGHRLLKGEAHVPSYNRPYTFVH